MKKKIKGSQNRKKRMNSSINNKKKFTLKFHFIKNIHLEKNSFQQK